MSNANTPSILVLGDSLSAAHNIANSAGWVTLLEDKLQTENTKIQVINASISGETTLSGLQRLTQLLDSHNPSIVILELGANDGLRGLSLTSIENNLESMIAQIQTNQSQLLLLGIQIPTNYGKIYRQRFANIYSELSEKHRLPFLPFLLEGIALKPKLMQADGIHPTAEAQTLILNNIWPKLAPLIRSIK